MKWKRGTQRELKASYRTVFGPSGGSAAQDIFLDLFEKSGMARTNFVPGSPDESAFNDGCRSIFLHILQMAYEPDAEVEKIKETLQTEYIDD